MTIEVWVVCFGSWELMLSDGGEWVWRCKQSIQARLGLDGANLPISCAYHFDWT